MLVLARAEAAEHELSEGLDRNVVTSVIYTSGERDPRLPITRPDNGKPGARSDRREVGHLHIG